MTDASDTVVAGPAPTAFLAGEGEMARRIRGFAWAATPLGDPADWPIALKTLVGLMLGSTQPMFLAWGPDKTWLYNDAFVPILGRKHPQALGRPALGEVWAEALEDLQPLFDKVFSGEPVHMDDFALMLDRHGRLEEAHFAYSYTPVRDETGRVSGLFGVCIETTAQVMSDRRLRAETDRQRRLFQRAPGFIAILEGPEHRFEFANQAYVDMVGREVVGRTVRQAFPEIEGQGFFEVLDQVYETGERYVAHHVPVRLVTDARAPAEELRLDFIYEPVTDESGTVTGIFVEGHDVTEAQRTQQALQATQRRQALLLELGDRFRDLEDPADIAYAAAELLGGALDVSRAGYGAVDLAAETITIDRDWNAPGIASLAGVLRFRDYGSYIEDLKRGETVVFADAYEDPRTRSGAEALRAISAQAAVNMPVSEQGGMVALLYLNHHEARPWTADELDFVRDVAERTRTAMGRRRAERELLALTASLEELVVQRTHELDRVWRNSRDLLVVIATDGVFRAVSPAWTEVLGHQPHEVVGRSFLEFIYAEDAGITQGSLDEAASGRDLTSFENRYLHKDGAPRWISWHTAQEGDLVYAYGRDITAEKQARAELAQESLERRRAEEALRQSQKMEAIGQLTGGVAHDFNNLLTVIRSSAELLRKPDLTEERRRKYVDAIAETAERGARLTGQLLSFARRQALRPHVFDAAQRLEGTVEMLKSLMGSRIALELDIAERPAAVEADPSQFETALVNLAANARDAMEGEGRLQIRLDRAAAGPDAAAAWPHGFIRITVTDDGCGIPPERLARVFEPFFTTKEVGRGTGLGLSQVYGFAAQSGGEVTVESRLGEGAAFTLYLPASDQPVPISVPGHLPAGSDLLGGSVLVVEDNSAVGEFSAELLHHLGYRTVLASNAGEALELLETSADSFDVVFTDVVMPGMDGVALGQEIRRRWPGLPIILTSGYSHVLAQDQRHGFELLHKPYAADALAEALQRARSRVEA